jgi:hypothetical protein
MSGRASLPLSPFGRTLKLEFAFSFFTRVHMEVVRIAEYFSGSDALRGINSDFGGVESIQ